jgi:hypothetical protein
MIPRSPRGIARGGRLRYTHFEFTNFKGIKHARLDLAPAGSSARVYTLVGLNESGKTTILEAIEQFQGESDSEILPKQLEGIRGLDPNDVIPIARRTNFTDKIVISCGIELDDADIVAVRDSLAARDGYRLESLDRVITISDTHRYVDSKLQERGGSWAGIGGSGYLRTGTVRRSLAGDAEGGRRKEILHLLKARLPSILYFPHFLFNFPQRIYIEPADNEENANRFFRELFQEVLSSVGDLDTERHIVQRYRSDDPADKANMQQVLLAASRDVTNKVITSWEQIFSDKPIGDKRVTIDIGELPAQDERPARVWVEFGIADTDGLFKIAERSLGFRWFFTYLMLTIYRGQRKPTDNNMLYLFDEPASNLHPTAQHALLGSLADLSKKAVIVYTTHSHYLIEPKWLGLTSVVANAGLGEDALSAEYTAQDTDVTVTPYHQFASTRPKQAYYFQPILDVLAYAPSAIDPAPEAVMTEGRGDFYLLRYVEEVMLARGADERLRWMPGAGAGSFDALMQLYVGWARPFIALLDSDNTGVRERKRYEEKFGPIVSDKLVALAEVSDVPAAKGIETLLSEQDRLEFQRVLNPEAVTYDKGAWLLGVQEALVTGRHVNLSEEALAALTYTVDQLRERIEAQSKHRDAGPT